ncbi:nascent polypeptide-associated complex protein [Candidatus Micrarchaeota archaeon]|nr:nascent polypeptide-associated complex protein [Candidatus Micrarchaeota archaeon]
MLPNMDPKQMQRLMKQMGINSREIAAKKVVIETGENNIIITDPQIVEINMQGQKSFQISGNVSVQEQLNNEDVKLIIEQTGVTEEEAVAALKESNGDIAAAILKLKK